MRATNFIDEKRIGQILENNCAPAEGRINEVLDKAREAKTLTLDEAAVLLAPMTPRQLERLFQTALEVKKNIYGNRIVLVAPVYVTNECGNRCAYCAFSSDNRELERRSLTDDELALEIQIMQSMGHKRVLAVYGEHPKWTPEAIAHSIDVIYSVRPRPGAEIRRANVNCAPLTVEGFKTVKDVGIGTYQCFQETYHQNTYEKVHLGGRKKDYLWRLLAHHRANEGGIDDVGLGVLFGLHDHRFEILSLLEHARILEEDYGAGPHTISVPRIEPAQNSDLSTSPPNPIDDNLFRRIVAVLRLALPYTGMIISTREGAVLKKDLLHLGISQMGAGSRSYPGGYADSVRNKPEAQQFWVADVRDMAAVVEDLMDMNFIPSFCTACYRMGRTGEEFMGLAKSAFIHNYCELNALTTFSEYLADYGTEPLKAAGRDFITRHMAKLSPAQQTKVNQGLSLLAAGQRDIYI